MRFDFYPLFLLFTYGSIALFLLALGIRGILTQKPVLISGWWNVGVMFINLMPIFLNAFLIKTSSQNGWSEALSINPWLNALFFNAIFLMVLVIAAWISPQYLGFGINDSSFREGLINTLQKMEIPFEKNLSGIYLPSIGANLRVASWIGIARVSVRPRKFSGVLRDIVQGMSSYYQTVNVSVNFMIFYFCLVFGALMMIPSIRFLISLIKPTFR